MIQYKSHTLHNSSLNVKQESKW